MRGFAAAAATVVGLAAVVAAASGGAPVWIPSRGAILDRNTIVPFLFALFAVGILLAVGISVAVHRWLLVPRHGSRPLRSTLRRATAPSAIVLVLVGLGAIASGWIGAPPEDPEVRTYLVPPGLGKGLIFKDPRQPTVDATPQAGVVSDEGAALQPRIGVIASLVLLALLVCAGVWWGTGRGARGRVGAGPEEEDLEGVPDRGATRRAVVRSIDEMLADTDPNTAVIGAYARLLEGLAGSGAPRRPEEGPEEHLERVLRTLQVRSAPLRDLVRLFAAARFSATSLTTGDRAAALASLRAVADDLGGAP